MVLKNLLVRVGADVTGFSKGLDKAQQKLNGFALVTTALLGKLGKTVASVGAVIGTGFLVGQGVQDAIKYEAQMDMLSQTMGNSRQDYIAWQEQVGRSMGYSKLVAADMASKLSIQFRSIADSQKDLVGKTTKMMEAAAIVANKRGLSMEEVSDRIRSAMNQEADGADELGVNVRVAAIQMSDAYKEMADGRPWDKLNENMRRTILYHHTLQQISENLGDTLADNTALRMQIFTASLQDLRLSLGSAFLPILHTVLPLLTAFVNKLERAMQIVYAFVSAIFGYRSATKYAKENTKATEGQKKAVVGLGDATEEAGKKAKKAGKDAQRGVMGFDELHLLQEKTQSGGGADGGGADVGDLMPEEPQKNSFLEGVNQYLNIYGENIAKIQKKLEDFFKTSEGWRAIKDGWDSITEAFKKLYEGSAFRGLWTAFKNDLPNFFDNLAQVAGGALQVLGGALQLIVALVQGDWTDAWEGFKDVWWGLQDVFNGTIGMLFPRWGKQLDEGTKTAKTKWGEVFNYFSSTEKPFRTILESIRQKITIDLAKGIYDFSISAKGHWDKMPNYWNTAMSKIKSIWETTFRGMPSWMQDIISRASATLPRYLGAAIDGIKIKFDKLKSTFNTIVNAFDKSFGSGVKSIINIAIDRINNMIKGFNEIKNKIPGGSKIGDIKTIPRLAQGGITTGPMLAMIGDNPSGHEAVIPLEKIQGIVTTAVTSAMRFYNGGNNNVGGDIILNIDGRQFARIVRPHLLQEAKRVGTNVKLNPI